jgi:ankyrin repeat protein
MDAQNVEGFAPLHLAAQNGHVDVVKEFIERGAQKDIKTQSELTPLYLAAMNGHVDIVKQLLEIGADMNAQSDAGVAPLHLAAVMWAEPDVDLLIGKGSDIDCQMKDGQTALFLACENSSKIVKKLLMNGANVLLRDGSKKTALEYLTSRYANPQELNTDQLTSVFLLLAAEVDIKCARDLNGIKVDVPLSFVDRDLEKKYLRHAQSQSIEDPAYIPRALVLYVAIGRGFEDIAKELIDKVDLTSLTFSNNHTALQLACLKYPDLAKEMIRLGSDPWAVDELNFTPLHFAIFNGDEDLCLQILSAENVGERCNSAAGIGQLTPLHFAAGLGKESVVEQLLALKANPNATNSNQNTPLHLSRWLGYDRISEMLIQNGASESLLNINGQTPQAFAKDLNGLADDV